MEALANNMQVLFQGLALGSIYALVALGFRALSLSPSALGAVKAMLLELDTKKAKAVLDPLVDAPSAGISVRARLQAFAEAEGLPL